MRKIFVLDTNVLLHDPRAMFKFADNEVVVPIFVIEEVDKFKRQANELGRNAREASRLLDRERLRGNLREGVVTKSGGVLRVGFKPKESRAAHDFIEHALMDNLILSVAVAERDANPDTPTTFVSKDTNLRVRADALGLDAANYEEDMVPVSKLYPGACEIHVDDELIARMHEDGEVHVDRFETLATITDVSDTNPGARLEEFYPNEYVLLRGNSGSNQSSLGRISLDPDDDLSVIVRPLDRRESVWGVRPRNKEQAFALDALLDDDVKLVTLIGKAGTGKTLLAIAAGLRQVTDEQSYHKLVVSRPIFPMGRDVGFLPGSLEEKLNPWMQPIFDNVEYLMGLSKADKRAGRGAEELMDMGIIDIEPLTYIRGRSLPNQYFIVDEAQNLTPHEVKTILTRVGEGTKIVLTGDPYQIDNPYVDSESNGLTHVLTRFKNEPISATVTLFKGERSELAEYAANLL